MCGIGGFSLSPGSKIKPRQLANSMLTALESRGGMASGFAYQDETRAGLYKQPVNGASLSLKRMPKDVSNVILHTRLATHGSIQDNRNNHPVVSPNHQVALVHNGVIYNHEAVRLKLNSSIDFDVDTSVIPALIEEDISLSNLDELDGDAAIAWFDERTAGTLHVGRLEHSPLVLCQLVDGSTLFMSTESLMWDVLIQLDLEPEYMLTAPEYTYYQLRQGMIASTADLPKSKHDSWYNRYNVGYYRKQTAGGKGSLYYGDEWDDDEVSVWNESFIAPDAMTEPVSHFYIQTRDRLSTQFDFTYYDIDEYELFKNDIWFLQEADDDNVLIDFGRIDDESAVMTSYSGSAEVEAEDIAKLGLVL